MSINPLNDISEVYPKQVSVNEASKGDGNLANNYPPYDKVTRGDVIAGALGKDEMGGKKRKKKKVEESNDGNLANNYPPYDKVTRGDVISGRLGKDQMGGKKKVSKESYSNWREDLKEVMDKVKSNENDQKIVEKKVNNKIVINPKLDIGEAVEELGGILLEIVEVDEAYQPIDKDKENRMYRRAGNLARTAVSSTGKKKAEAQKKSSKIVSAITRQKEKERFDRIGQSPSHNEEVKLDEKTLTAAETKEKERIVKSMKSKASDFEKRYPGRGKEVMYATATKMAKKIAEQALELQPKTQAKEKPLDTAAERQQYTNLRMIQQKQQQLQKQKLNLQKQGRLPLSSESFEVLDERRKEDKVKQTPRKPRDKAFELVAKSMGSARMGVQPRGVKKEKGKKPPKAGEYGGPESPAQKAKRRADAQKAKDMMHSRFD